MLILSRCSAAFFYSDPIFTADFVKFNLSSKLVKESISFNKGGRQISLFNRSISATSDIGASSISRLMRSSIVPSSRASLYGWPSRTSLLPACLMSSIKALKLLITLIVLSPKVLF